jgi:hypothetical protein
VFVIELRNLANPFPALLRDLLALALKISLQLILYLYRLLRLLQTAFQLQHPRLVSF